MNNTIVYEVFSRQKAGGPMVHAGSVTATSGDLAVIYAREVYGRRGESLELWVVRREEILTVDDADLLHPALDRSYRTVEGYRLRDKLRTADADALPLAEQSSQAIK